ncbi:uncharacterized protein YsxB (DUF464 family) [Paenibacillus shirakamiensis]|uniref:Ribosomal processing cysteine protease Prp n=1 Tax=Paenibacillus shirakamiensis TaxID=1265935 RepID=A0ABS4JFB4_9BACL|nr:ribosomal-processing cysteine protease Prp [Paenibacillus shirakamiensis]MBP2000393.1 uncharacterized protein YsxB (DUF464 family) [Paenibacillus shirakamiensis]
MIIVSILHDAESNIQGFKVEGHANYADAGKDIVCAGVSAVTVGTVNSIEALAGIEMDTQMKNGFLSAFLPKSSTSSADQQVQLLLSSLVIMLQSIEQSYNKYIRINNVNL